MLFLFRKILQVQTYPPWSYPPLHVIGIFGQRVLMVLNIWMEILPPPPHSFERFNAPGCSLQSTSYLWTNGGRGTMWSPLPPGPWPSLFHFHDFSGKIGQIRVVPLWGYHLPPVVRESWSAILVWSSSSIHPVDFIFQNLILHAEILESRIEWNEENCGWDYLNMSDPLNPAVATPSSVWLL